MNKLCPGIDVFCPLSGGIVVCNAYCPVLSTSMIIGNSRMTPMVSIMCLAKMTSFASSGVSKYYASVEESVTLFPAFDFHAIEPPQKNRR
jgi:hypothetical protein